MKKTLVALVFGAAMSIPATLDAFMVPCTAKVITIREYPTIPINSIDRTITSVVRRESLSLWDKYRYGVVYSHSTSYEEGVCPIFLPDETPYIIFGRE